MADKYFIYTTNAEALKRQEHLDELAKKDGWREEVVGDLTVGPRCTHVREAIAKGTFESSGLADKILRRHWEYPKRDESYTRWALKADALAQKYDGDTDQSTGDKIDMKNAKDLPADWDPDLAVAEAPAVIK